MFYPPAIHSCSVFQVSHLSIISHRNLWPRPRPLNYRPLYSTANQHHHLHVSKIFPIQNVQNSWLFPKKKKEVGEKRRERTGREEKGKEGTNKQVWLFVLHPCHSAHDCHPSSSTGHNPGFLLDTFSSPSRDSSPSPVLFPLPPKCLFFSLFLLNLLGAQNEVVTNITLCLDYCNNFLSLAPNHHCPHSNPTLLPSFNSFPLLLG